MGKMTKKLGLIHTICIASGALISSGLFVLPGLAHARAGPAVIISYLLAGLLAAAGLLSVAELSTAMPKPGGDYFFISRALGSGVGTVAGFLSWFSISLKAAFALVGIGALAELALPIDGRIFAGLFLAIFSILNLYGVKKAANLQTALALALFLMLGGFVAFGIGSIKAENFTPFAPEGWAAVFGTAGFVFVAFGAAMKIASMAGEIKNPGKNIPRGIGFSMGIVTLLYVAVVGVSTGVLSGDQLDHSLTPVSDAAEAFSGRAGMIIMSVGALLAFLTTANAGIMTSSRYLLALSEDKLAPEPLSRLRGGSGSPWVAILMTTALLAFSILVPLKILVESASVVFVIMYILASLSIIVLHEGKVQNYRPVFRAPFYPYLQVAAIIGFFFVLFEMGGEALLIAGVLICAALSFYWFYGRHKRDAESALLHLIERVTSRELIEGDLEDELREIIRRREKIETDRLDRVIRRSPVLDIEESISVKEFFKLAADKLAHIIDEDSENITEKLLHREQEANTILRPGVAVPHLLVDVKNTYEILIARGKEGVVFPGQDKPVHALFVLVSSLDNRDFHLKVLAGIAQMVQAPEFDENWMNARDEDRLKDLLLLEERMRIG